MGNVATETARDTTTVTQYVHTSIAELPIGVVAGGVSSVKIKLTMQENINNVTAQPYNSLTNISIGPAVPINTRWSKPVDMSADPMESDWRIPTEVTVSIKPAFTGDLKIVFKTISTDSVVGGDGFKDSGSGGGADGGVGR